MRVLCLLTLPVTWKVASSLKQDDHQICLLPTSPAFGYKSHRELICRCLLSAGANPVCKVSYACVFLPLAKRLLKASEVQDLLF